MSQYAILVSLLNGWRTDFGANTVELWAVGYPGSASSVTGFMGSSQEPLFADSATMAAFSAFGATKDDLFIIDRQGAIAHSVSLASMSLTDPSNASQLDAWVRALLQ